MLRWDAQLGRDPWKNLIAEECRQIAGGLTSPVEIKPKLLIKPQTHAPLSWVCIASENASPSAASWLVFQTGRYFCVGAPSGAIDCLTLAEESLRLRHYHIVLLSWERKHYEGLAALIGKRSRVTVWTSRWIWDECRRTDPSLRVLPTRSLENYPIDPVLEAGDAVSAVPLCEVRTFEQAADVLFTLGVSLKLRYTLSGLMASSGDGQRTVVPSLAACFLCSGAQVLVDPFRTAGRISSSSAEFVREFPQLRSAHAQRAEQLNWLGYNAHCGWSDEWQTSHGSDVDLTARGATLADLRVRRPEGRGPATLDERLPERPITPGHAVGSSPTVGVVLLCGTLFRRTNAETIDPGRMLKVRVESDRIAILPILEWRLRQIQKLYPNGASVFIVTSPDTHPVVHQIVTRFRPEFPACDIRFVTAWLSPLYVERDDMLEPLSTPDGGWILTVSGHLNWIPALARLAELPDMLVVIAHNNLGAVLDEQTKAEVSSAFHRDEPITFELCDMQNDGIPDERWSSFSYLSENSYLWKPEYDQSPVPSSGLFSTMTAYVRTQHIREQFGAHIFADPKAALQSYLGNCAVIKVTGGISEPGTNVYAIRRDFDFVTHQGPLTRFIIYRGGKAGLYGYRRFFSVRREDHLRDASFWREFAAAQTSGVDVPRAGIEEEQIRDRTLWELVPVEKRYVWSGNRIAKMKGEPDYWNHPIAETWELSTHESGTASCSLDVRRSVPFSEVFQIHVAKRNCEFMAKYLDCNGKLSLQVHPNDLVARYLSDKREFRVSDERGKEETFFVIEPAADRAFHLFLGFHQERMEPLAAVIRPELHRQFERVRGAEDFKTAYPHLLRAMRETASLVIADWGEPFAGRSDFQSYLLRSFAPDWCALRNGANTKAPMSTTIELQTATTAEAPVPFDDVLKWHLVEHPLRLHSEGLPLSLLGREYLIAALVLIRAVQELALLGAQREDLKIKVKKLLDYSVAAGTAADCLNQHPVFRYFRTVRLEKGAWGRVPAGTVHAWQDGGNSLIEVADNSDNTFRILDFGRELETPPRRMHYAQAMYALTDESILGEAAVERLLKSPHVQSDAAKQDSAPASDGGQDAFQTPAAWQPFHAHVEHAEIHGQQVEIDIKDFAAVMNPEGPLDLYRGSDIMRVSPASTVFIAPSGGRVIAKPGRDGIAIAFRPRTPPRPVLCISFGARRVAVAVQDPSRSPSSRWFHETIPTPLREPADAVDHIARLVERLCLSGVDGSVGICWPGPVDDRRCYTTAFAAQRAFEKIEVLDAVLAGLARSGGFANVPIHPESVICFCNDAFLSALGEKWHARGRARGSNPLVVNLGSGLCAGWIQQEGDPTAFEPSAYLGRWIYVDSVTASFLPQTSETRERVFTATPATSLGSPRSIRSSVYFSFGGLVLRWLSRLPAADRSGFLNVWEHAPVNHLLQKEFTESANEITHDPERYPRFAFMRRINEYIANRADPLHRQAYAFAAEYAYDLVGCIKTLESTRKSPGAFTDIILTGSVGESFGRAEDGDPFKELLGRLLPGKEVQRSNIAPSVLRELAGVVHISGLARRRSHGAA